MNYEEKLRKMTLSEIENEIVDIQEKDKKLFSSIQSLKKKINHLTLNGKDWQKKHNFYLQPVNPVTTLDAIRKEYNDLVRQQGHLNYRLKMISIVVKDMEDEEI